MGIMYTIGHSNFKTEDFIGILNHFEISCVVDVRSNPFSQFVPQYNIDELKKTLRKKRILYIYMGKELGGRPANPSFYTTEGLWDYYAISNSNIFQDGISRLMMGLDKGYNIALMCSEFLPINCHRSLIIGRYLYSEYNMDVKHICKDKITKQSEVEKMLYEMYFSSSDSKQLSFFDKPSIEEIYLLRIRDIFNASKLKSKVK